MVASNAPSEKADASRAVPQNPESKKVVKPKPKPKSGKKAPPTVIHADPSDFRNLVQQLTRSDTDGVKRAELQPSDKTEPKSKPVEIPAAAPGTPLESGLTTATRSPTLELETAVKSRIQTLAPPPLRPTVINTRIIQPKPSHADPDSAGVRPIHPLSLSVSRLTSFFQRGAMPGLPSPSLGTLFSPLVGLFSSSRHAVASPGWPSMDAPGEAQSDEESPGAVAFREALTVMLPPGEAKESLEVSSAQAQSPQGVEEEGGGDGTAMQIEAV